MFKVTIVEITQRDVVKQEYEKLADTKNKYDNGAVYGYVEKKATERVERQVLTQEVETVDVAAVIKAINNL